MIVLEGQTALSPFRRERLEARLRAVHPDTRRLVQLTVENGEETRALMDMLLAKKRASDRKTWLETKGDLATLEA